MAPALFSCRDGDEEMEVKGSSSSAQSSEKCAPMLALVEHKEVQVDAVVEHEEEAVQQPHKP